MCSKRHNDKKIKSFKDPVYGYIEIPSDLVEDIIDTEAFQRLRRIAQTSYEPLYPSATHNRFVHSFGVYHLGDIVAGVIKKKSFSPLKAIMGKFTKKYIRYLEVFRLACLLHDVGHAPFSHTGEGFFITTDEKGKATKLHQRVARLCGDKSFSKEIDKREKSAAPHELMSVIIALATFGDQFKTDNEKTFFARAITGYPYALGKPTSDHIDPSFLNCLIKLLNSSIVDVDRLDYLIRDAIETGFKTVTIDYQRLLEGIRIRNINGKCEVVFTKQSISVLESVVFAHDAEKKWVQNHPSIIYEMAILKEAFLSVNNHFAANLPGKSIFCEAALIGKGVMLNQFQASVKYLCDDDIVFLMKNLNDEASHLFLCRKDRHLPLWKSEAEFCALFSKDMGQDNQMRMMIVFERFLISLRNLGISEINEDALVKLDDQRTKARGRLQKVAGIPIESFGQEEIEGQRSLVYCFAEIFRQFSDETKVLFNFRIFDAKMFKSGFETKDLSNMLIELGPGKEDIVSFGNITRVLGGQSNNSCLPNKVYYVFAKELVGDKVKLSHTLVNLMKKFIRDNSGKIDRFFGVNKEKPSSSPEREALQAEH